MMVTGFRYKLSTGEAVFKVFNYSFLTVLALITLYPFYFIVVGSLSNPNNILEVYLWPKDFFYANYIVALTTPELGWAFLISILRVATAVPGMLLVTSAAAFVLSRREMLLRTPIILFFFITMFFSGGLIPYYLTIKRVGLYDSFLVYVIPSLFSVWSMIVMKTSIQSLPEGLVDAAIIDGASHARIYFQIILPLSKAILAVLGLFAAVSAWNDWFTGVFYVKNAKLKPLQTLLQTEALSRTRGSFLYNTGTRLQNLDEDSKLYSDFKDLYDRPGNDDYRFQSLRRAYIVVALLPIIFLYPFLQKYFVKGVLIGSIKE